MMTSWGSGMDTETSRIAFRAAVGRVDAGRSSRPRRRSPLTLPLPGPGEARLTPSQPTARYVRCALAPLPPTAMFATDEGYIDDEILSPVASSSGADPARLLTPRSVHEREGAWPGPSA